MQRNNGEQWDIKRIYMFSLVKMMVYGYFTRKDENIMRYNEI